MMYSRLRRLLLLVTAGLALAACTNESSDGGGDPATSHAGDGGTGGTTPSRAGSGGGESAGQGGGDAVQRTPCKLKLSGAISRDVDCEAIQEQQPNTQIIRIRTADRLFDFWLSNVKNTTGKYTPEATTITSSDVGDDDLVGGGTIRMSVADDAPSWDDSEFALVITATLLDGAKVPVVFDLEGTLDATFAPARASSAMGEVTVQATF